MKSLHLKFPIGKLPFTPNKKVAISLNTISKRAESITELHKEMIPEKERRHYDRLTKQSQSHQLNHGRINIATIDYDNNLIDFDPQDDGILKKLLFTIKKSYIGKHRYKQREKEPQTRNSQKKESVFNLKGNSINNNSSMYIRKFKSKDNKPTLIRDSLTMSMTIQQQNLINNQTISTTLYTDRIPNKHKDFFYPALNKNCSKIMLEVLKNEKNSQSLFHSINQKMKNNKLIMNSFSEKRFKEIKSNKKMQDIANVIVKNPVLVNKDKSSLIAKDKEIYNDIMKKESFRFFDTIL